MQSFRGARPKPEPLSERQTVSLRQSPEADIESLVADMQVPERHITQPRRQDRVDVEHLVRRIRLEPENRVQQREN